jgi:hypothetical protein
MNRASDLNTSADKLHLTNVSKASIKLSNTSARKLSAFRASRNRFVIPALVSNVPTYVKGCYTHSS